MLQIKNLNVKLTEGKDQILTGLNLEVNPGEIHILNGRNGSGKSTLVNTIMGNPAFEIMSGEMKLVDEKYEDYTFDDFDQQNKTDFVEKQGKRFKIRLNELDPNERSMLGIFLANQYPPEIPGVNLSNYLRIIYNKRKKQSEKLPVFKFRKVLHEAAERINYPVELLKRNLNEGFSGGEKKKTEILQMLLIQPRYIMLDEIDSGLDRESVKEVFGALKHVHESLPHTSFVIITHYDRVKDYLEPDLVHEMSQGKLLDNQS